MEWVYISQGDYYLLDLETNEEEYTYGIIRKGVPNRNWSGRYGDLILTGKLMGHLKKVDNEARKKLR